MFGIKSPSHMSSIEHGKSNPKLEVALAAQVVFGIPPSEMFPHVFTVVEDRVMWNICQFHLAREKSTSPEDLRKCELCKLALDRVEGIPKPPKGV